MDGPSHEIFRGTPRRDESLDAKFTPFRCGKNGEEFPSTEIMVGGMPPGELGDKAARSFNDVSDNARRHLVIPEDYYHERLGQYFAKGLRCTFAHQRKLREIRLTVGQLASVKDKAWEKPRTGRAMFAEHGKSIEVTEGKLDIGDLRFIPYDWLEGRRDRRDLFQKWGDVNLADAYELERNTFETAAYLMLQERNQNILIPAIDPSSMGVFSIVNNPTGERSLDYIDRMDGLVDGSFEVALLLRNKGERSLTDMYHDGWFFKDPKETLGQVPRPFPFYSSGSMLG